MHRRSTLIIAQRDATQSSLFIILQVLSTCFGCQPHPSSAVHKTVTTASGTGHSLATLEGDSCTKLWPVQEAVVTVLCTPDDGCGWHQKHVEWSRRIINRLLCVAFRWAIINLVLLELATLLRYSLLHLFFTSLLFVIYCTEANRYQSWTVAVLFSIITIWSFN